MAQFPRLRVVSIVKRVPFRFEATPTALVSAIERVPIMTLRSTPLQLQIWWGHDAAVANGDQLEIYLLAVNEAESPDLSSARARAIWSAVNKWVVVGTDAYAVQTITHENIMFLAPEGVSNVNVGERPHQFVWGFIFANTTSAQLALGSLAIQHDLLIRTWGNDNWTFNSEDTPNSEGLTEIDTDVGFD